MTLTQGVSIWLTKKEIRPYEFISVVSFNYDNQPEKTTDGGNDKEFFTFEYQGKKFFAAKNEIDSLTIMFPEEY